MCREPTMSCPSRTESREISNRIYIYIGIYMNVLMLLKKFATISGIGLCTEECNGPFTITTTSQHVRSGERHTVHFDEGSKRGWHFIYSCVNKLVESEWRSVYMRVWMILWAPKLLFIVIAAAKEPNCGAFSTHGHFGTTK